MKPTPYFYFLVSLAALLLMPKLGCIAVNVGGGGCSAAKFKTTRSLTAPAAPSVAVQARNGQISLRRGDVPQTQITAHLAATTQARLDGTQVLTETRPDGTLAISVAWPGGAPQNNESASFDVTLPALTGAVSATTSNGAIRLANLSGPAKLQTSNGPIAVDDHAGPVDARTSNGRVTLARVTGDAEAHTSNGPIDIKDVTGRATAHTSNGRVTLSLAPTSPGPIDVRTSNGSADVTLPPTYSGQLALSTSNGSVNYPTAPSVHDLKSGRNFANFAVGDSTDLSTVTTSNGSVDVRFAN
jgi:DUF4097 and DUF4098 domain-containing protein YvlB